MKERTIWTQLVLSIISFFLCIALLVGSTFAWFSMQTENRNTIMAGSLSVSLWRYKIGEATPTKVDTSDKLFDIQYWEPGMMAYENLVVKNNGDMALKYQLSLKDYAHNYIQDGTKQNSLLDVLQVYVVEGGFKSGNTFTTKPTREQAMAAIAAAKAAGQNYSIDEVIATGQLEPESDTTNGPLDKEDNCDTYGVILYWEPNVVDDNKYNVAMAGSPGGVIPAGYTPANNDRLFIDCGVFLFATQLPHESDSFDNTYDKYAGVFEATSIKPVVKPLIVPVDPNETDKIIVRDPEEGETLTLDVKNQDMTVTYTVGTKLTEETQIADDKKTADAKLGFEYKSETSNVGVSVGEGQKLANYELTLNIAQDNTILNKVTKKIPANLINVVVYHHGTPMANAESASDTPTSESYYYDSDGTLTIWVFHASEIDVVYDLPDATITMADGTEIDMAFTDFVKYVNAGNSCEGCVVKLNKDVNLKYDINANSSAVGWVEGIDPIGITSAEAFKGIFDGGNHTIKNFHKEWLDNIGIAGVFGYVKDATIKNLTVSNFSTMSFGSNETVGGVAAIATGNCTFENITLDHCRLNAYNDALGGVIGYIENGHVDMKNINVDDTVVLSSTQKACDTSIGGLVGTINIANATVSFDNCNVSAKVMPLNDIMANNAFWTYRNSGMVIGTLHDPDYSGNGGIRTATEYLLEHTIISCKDVTVNYGDWAQQYYAYLPYETIDKGKFVSLEPSIEDATWFRVTNDLSIVEDRAIDAYDDNNETWGQGYITLGLGNVRYINKGKLFVHLVTIEGKQYVVASAERTVNSLSDAFAHIETSEYTGNAVKGSLDTEVFDALFGVEQYDVSSHSLKTYPGVTVNYNYEK